ncbi:hypothetical protein J6590_014614 [Homalodisca vitripennis]|nr:hypothetical protein J6590_014614 [Homalodisca vitripennis]
MVFKIPRIQSCQNTYVSSLVSHREHQCAEQQQWTADWQYGEWGEAGAIAGTAEAAAPQLRGVWQDVPDEAPPVDAHEGPHWRAPTCLSRVWQEFRTQTLSQHALAAAHCRTSL